MLSRWPRAMSWSADQNNKYIFQKKAQPRFSRPFLARFGSELALGSGLGLGLGLGLGGGLGLHPYLYPTGSAFCSQTRTAHRPKDAGGQLVG